MTNTFREALLALVGPTPDDRGWVRRMRLHQGWWRACVLGVPPGPHPQDASRRICNTIDDGETSGSGFIHPWAEAAARRAITDRASGGRGMLLEDRFFNNLLSSQPLAVNHFALFRQSPELALAVMRLFFPDLKAVKAVHFEHAPAERYSDDNSAFDVALEVESARGSGLIGIECKYTDSFSATEYKKAAYADLHARSGAFQASYVELCGPRFNQLFRNQLVAEGLVLNGHHDFVDTVLFCSHLDEPAVETGRKFAKHLTLPQRFQVITYRDFIQHAQRADLTWEEREYVMMLWARYSAVALSGAVAGPTH